jgi:hypothetical protein
MPQQIEQLLVAKERTETARERFYDKFFASLTGAR